MDSSLLNNLKELIPYFPIETTYESLLLKVAFVFIISIISSASIYFINKLLIDTREKNVLGLSEGATLFKWVSGAALTTLLLFGLQIIAYKIQAIIVVAFVWDKFFEKMYNSAQSDVSKDKNDLKTISEEDVQDII